MAELPIATQCGTGAPAAPPGFQPRIGVRGMPSIAGVSVLDVKGFQVAGE